MWHFNSFFKKSLKTSNCNYLFWLFWIISLTVSSAFFTQGNLLFTGEAFLFFSTEALFLAFLLGVLEKINARMFLKIATGFLAFLFLFHLINLILMVLLDANLGFFYTMLFQDQTNNFLVKMRATRLSRFYFILIGLVLVVSPFLARHFYIFTQNLSWRLYFKKKLTLFPKILFLAFIIFLSTLSCFDFIACQFSQNRLTKKLCFSTLFQPSKDKVLTQKLALQKFTKAKASSFLLSNASIPALNLNCPKKPPIFLFVIESLRYDAISSKTTPCLNNFKKENFSFKNSYANANCTQQAWFSIFFSELPWHWTNPQKQGSLPLKIFKQLGYKIEVLSSAELAYFDMKQKLFGKNLELVDSLKEFKAKESFERDALAFQTLKQKEFSDNTLYIVFLDTPHCEYSHPPKNQKFTPTAHSLNYLRLALFPTQEALFLKNRYLNCINYLDSLFQDFFESLKAKNIYQKSMIVITGDHGEEFYENGAFFHGSRLSEAQIKIPLIYKIPDLPGKSSQKISSYTSQIDIFPTIFHVLTGQQLDFFEGSSIFSTQVKEIFSFNQNGGLDPVDFILRSPKKKNLDQIQK